MRIAHATALLAALFTSGLAVQAAAPVPRPSKEFTITLPDGKQQLLSSYRGKVVMAAFMFTTCPHCQALSKVITKLQGELGPRGFQAYGAVFNDEVNTPNPASNAQVTGAFVSQFGVGFPVGYAPRASVLSFLGVSEIESWVVPQIAIIDRKGVIRAQSASRGTTELQTETYLRKYLGELLDEGGAKSAAPAKAAPSKATPKKAADKKTS
jgi:thiol-disulfide isomerase/thioredoxin